MPIVGGLGVAHFFRAKGVRFGLHTLRCKRLTLAAAARQAECTALNVSIAHAVAAVFKHLSDY